MMFITSVLLSLVPKFITLIVSKRTELRAFTLYVPSQFLYFLVLFLKKHTLIKIDQLIDVCVVDFINSKKRFSLFYVFFSSFFKYRIFVRTFISEADHVPSLNRLFKNSLWIEREIWDMYGIFFYDHPDLRRILTDYGFSGFPLRKNFPLSGYIELRYDDEKMHIVYEPVELMQNYRYFNFLSPWESVSI